MKQKTRLILRIISVILLVSGIGVIIYPHIMQSIYDKQAESDYEEFIAQTEETVIIDDSPGTDFPHSDLYNAMVAYNEKIFAEGQVNLTDPWSYEQASFNLDEYGFDENVIGYISIPKIDVLLPIYLGASNENMQKGATHLSQTSLPIGGENTNSVICGHRGYWGAKMFKHLVDLEPGDEVIVTNLWHSMTYIVAETTTIRDNELDNLKIQSGKDMLTLFTCYYQSGRKDRFVVFCERS